MNKNLTPRFLLILILVGLAAYSLIPPSKTLKPGIDLAGGTSMIFEIDTQGLKSDELSGLSTKMITVLRRRVDPANIQNLIWRPQGNTRFEIQMPLANKETKLRREAYNDALSALLDKNVDPVEILSALQNKTEKRSTYFTQWAQNDPNRMESLENLAKIFDQRTDFRIQRDTTALEMQTLEKQMKEKGINVEAVKRQRLAWSELSEKDLADKLSNYPVVSQDPNAATAYVVAYRKWAQAVEPLTGSDAGLNDQYRSAVRELDKLNLTSEQIMAALDLPGTSPVRLQTLEKMKTEFSDRSDLIDQVVTAYDNYHPFKGRLDDPADLQRMLKGAGVLEFRILPTVDRTDLTPEEIQTQTESLRDKGPQYASSVKYQWFEIETIEDWFNRNTIVGQFAGKYYVLASNKPEETMLHTTAKQDWALQRSNATADDMGRRAIGFLLDDKGGMRFAKLTGNNTGRPLCILLDNVAISAPNINSQIYRNGIITGSYSQEKQKDMVDKLNAGSLPARLIEQPISVKTIGPSIGTENRNKGIYAGFVGLIAVLVWMFVYYLKAGAIADVALLMNILFVLSIMAFMRATFTLPGIAGIILTIGMSVDANVLIFERIREEQNRGSSLSMAIKNGYQRAFRAIFDANLTTFITATILYWVASEEIKGFALVLMLGILSSMFSALFVTRAIFDMLTKKQIIKDKLVMLQLIKEPKINWMALRPVFFTISTILIVGGLVIFFARDDSKNNRFDIEFTGGTQVQVQFKDGIRPTRQEVQERLSSAAQASSLPALAAANIYSVGEPNSGQFEITTTETNKTTATLTLTGNNHTVESVTATILDAEDAFTGKLSHLRVTADNTPNRFLVTTSQINKNLVRNVLQAAYAEATISDPVSDEVVNSTIKEAFAGELAIQQNLRPELLAKEKITETTLAEKPILANALGGILIRTQLDRPASLNEMDKRLKDLRFKPDARDLAWHDYSLYNEDVLDIDRDRLIKEFVYVSVPPGAGLREISTEEFDLFLGNEVQRVTQAASLETSLPRVTQIDPSIGGEQTQRALIAIFLSLIAIVAYVWVRFGDLRYGLAAIAALVHDVCITLGAVSLSAYLAGTSIGDLLLISDFKINLAMIAAFLTLIGYSLNDTIVVFDRIRENRHAAQLTAQTITNSINQTISRTLLTSLTTFIVVLVMYIFGGDGLRGFTFAIGLGVIVGTYSSIAIAAPTLLIGLKKQKNT